MFIQDKAVTTDILQLVFNFLTVVEVTFAGVNICRLGLNALLMYTAHQIFLIDSTVTRKEPLIITEGRKALPKTKVQIFLLIV